MRSVVGILFGVALIWFGGVEVSSGESPQRLHDEGAKATGTVIEVRAHVETRRSGGRRYRSSEQVTLMCPVVSWSRETPAAPVQETFTEFDDCDRLEVGDEVTVMHDPDVPYSARIDSDAVLAAEDISSRLSWLLRGLGAAFVLFSGIALLLRVLERRARRAGGTVTE